MTEQRIRSEAVDYWSQHGEDDTIRSLADDLLDARARIKELEEALIDAVTEPLSANTLRLLEEIRAARAPRGGDRDR